MDGQQNLKKGGREGGGHLGKTLLYREQKLQNPKARGQCDRRGVMRENMKDWGRGQVMQGPVGPARPRTSL